MLQTMTLRRVDPLSAAKLVGMIYALFGLLGGAIASSVFVIGGIVGAALGRQSASPVVSILFGAGAIVFLPFLYGGLGFLGTLVAAAVYNWLAGWLGGIRWDVQISTPPSGPA